MSSTENGERKRTGGDGPSFTIPAKKQKEIKKECPHSSTASPASHTTLLAYARVGDLSAVSLSAQPRTELIKLEGSPDKTLLNFVKSGKQWLSALLHCIEAWDCNFPQVNHG